MSNWALCNNLQSKSLRVRLFCSCAVLVVASPQMRECISGSARHGMQVPHSAAPLAPPLQDWRSRKRLSNVAICELSGDIPNAVGPKACHAGKPAALGDL